MIACSPMTEDKSFRHKLHPGHKEKKWIFFGPETWVRPHYMIYVGTGNGTRSRKMTPEEWGELVVASQSKPVPLVDDEKRRWWLFVGNSNRYRCFHHSADEDDPQVIKGLILQKDARNSSQRERARKIAAENP